MLPLSLYSIGGEGEESRQFSSWLMDADYSSSFFPSSSKKEQKPNGFLPEVDGRERREKAPYAAEILIPLGPHTPPSRPSGVWQ